MPPREAVTYPDVTELSRAAADLIVPVAHAAVAQHGRFTLALSGGSTPRTLYRLFAAEYREKIPWAHAQIFFGDERCVTPDNHDSNYRMARAELLELIPGLLSRTHRIEGELLPEEAAKKYDAELREFFGDANVARDSMGMAGAAGQRPALTQTFDVLLLGIGTDGHTASLFPNSPALQEQEKLAVATEAPLTMTTRHRVTLTYPMLNAALTTLVLCAGADKQKIIHTLLTDPAADYPIAHITARDRLIWMMDQAAAHS